MTILGIIFTGICSDAPAAVFIILLATVQAQPIEVILSYDINYDNLQIWVPDLYNP